MRAIFVTRLSNRQTQLINQLIEALNVTDIGLYLTVDRSRLRRERDAGRNLDRLLVRPSRIVTYTNPPPLPRPRADMSVLRRFEDSAHGPWIWRLLHADGQLLGGGVSQRELTYEPRTRDTRRLLALADGLLVGIEDLFRAIQPDFVYGPETDKLGALLLKAYAMSQGIPSFRFSTTRLGNYLGVNADVGDTLWRVPEVYEAYSDGREAAEERRDAARRLVEPAGNLTARTYAFGAPRARSLVRRGLAGLQPYRVTRAFRKVITQGAFSRAYIRELSQAYLYFPLHEEPEAGLKLYSYWEQDQVECIAKISRAVDMRYMVYVKEHPVMHLRKLSHYREMLRYPNVRLMSPRIHGKEAIRRSCGVLTISGTAGLEAIVMGKPVVIFGGASWDILKSVLVVRDYSTAPARMREYLEAFDPASARADLEHYALAILDVCRPADDVVGLGEMAREFLKSC
ncbi:MAG: hypothetical protein HYV93_01570 [Candidatus Rokubacteria bacterium]|nr:hypothetical protein [Candidatus Rokubacteria bacterium]